MVNLFLAAEHSNGELFAMTVLILLFWGFVIYFLIKYGLIVLKHIISFFLPYWID